MERITDAEMCLSLVTVPMTLPRLNRDLWAKHVLEVKDKHNYERSEIVPVVSFDRSFGILVEIFCGKNGKNGDKIRMGFLFYSFT